MKEHRYTVLLVFLVSILVLYPYLEAEGASAHFLRCIFAGVILTCVFAVSKDRTPLLIAIALALPGLVGQIVPGFREIPWLDRHGQFFSLPLFVYVIVTVLADILRERHVRGDTLCGAASVYLLTGIAWISVYVMVEQWFPGSFKVPPSAGEGPAGEWGDLVYFSFTTLTTLGYGDITPVSAPAKSLSILEAINGVLYIAVLVSKLVGMNIESNARKEP